MRIVLGGLLLGVVILIGLCLLEPPTVVYVVVTPTATVQAEPTGIPGCFYEGRGYWYCP